MELKRIQLRDDNPNVYLDVYLNEEHETLSINKRPMILVIPGGGYWCCSKPDAEPVARVFTAQGYNAAILYYSLTKNAVNMNPLEDASRAMTVIRRNAEEWHIYEDKIAVIGFSAGGHLAGWLSTMWDNEDIMRRCGITKRGENRPDAAIMCYPVITSGEKAHKGSFYNLLGTNTPTDDQLALYSLENRVTDETPPCFLWHTAEDSNVPVENSLYMARALSEHNIPFELHVFPNGRHGLSLAVPEVTPRPDPYVARWADMAIKWLEKVLDIK